MHLKHFVLFFCILSLMSSLLLAQQSNLPLDLEELQKKSEKQLQKALPFEIQPLESKIDPEMYVLGPGDLLQIDIRGGAPEHLELMVTPEQRLLIPNIGEIDLSDLSLQQGKDRIRDFLNERYRNSQISISLISLRQFRVYVTGAVVVPGAIIVNGNMRVSDAIKEAGGLKQKMNVEASKEQTTLETAMHTEQVSRRTRVKFDENLELRPASQRNIRLERKNGTVQNVDLLKFSQGGDPHDNPFLIDGDVIVVPNEQIGVGQVAIWGAVRAPGEFEFVPGDDLGDLLTLGQGFTFDADKSNLEIVRFKADHRNTEIIKVNLTNGEVDPATITLQPDDRIYVRHFTHFNKKAQVQIMGEVQFPGKYHIIEGQTTLTEVIRQAGGFTPRASLAEATVIRKAMEDVKDNEFERLKEMNVEEMTEQEREYFKIKSREVMGAIAVDFERLFETKDQVLDVALMDRDEIAVPSISKTIKVTGQVVRPGLISFEDGKSLDYYIKKAGGYSWNARKSGVRVIRGQTGEWFKPNGNTDIYLGDTIFIPEKPERDYWELFKDYMLIAYQVATIYLVISQATK